MADIRSKLYREFLTGGDSHYFNIYEMIQGTRSRKTYCVVRIRGRYPFLPDMSRLGVNTALHVEKHSLYVETILVGVRMCRL